MANKGVQGVVVDRQGEQVKVRIFRNNTCENCNCELQDASGPDDESMRGRRGMFDVFGDRSTLEINATNDAGAEVGDCCVVKIRNEFSLVKGSFMVYLLPGILFLIGLFAGGWLATTYWSATGDAEILAQLGGGLFMLLASYLGAKLYLMLKGTAEYVPEVTDVVKRA